MKLWKLEQDENNDYDTFDSCIVAAETEEEARCIPPHHEGCNGYFGDSWCSSPDKVKVTLIGDALEGTKSGCILASFNAG